MPADAAAEQLVKGTRIADLEGTTKVNVGTLTVPNARAIAVCVGTAYNPFAAKADHRSGHDLGCAVAGKTMLEPVAVNSFAVDWVPLARLPATSKEHIDLRPFAVLLTLTGLAKNWANSCGKSESCTRRE